MKPIIGFVLGILAGCAGLLLAQTIFSSDPDSDAPAADENLKIAFNRQTKQLDTANKQIASLEAEIKAKVDPEAEGGAENLIAAGSDEEKESEGEEAASFLDAIMAFGDGGAKRGIDKQVAALVERLGLDDTQSEAVRAALQARAEKQKEIGKKMFTGKATLEDLISADEANFTESDAEIAALLDESQLETFAEYQRERETKRVEGKADEELAQLQEVADLTDEQADQAWRIFANLAIEEPPGELPEGAVIEDFGNFIDDAIGKRVSGLTPILAPEQLDAFRGGAAEWREGIVGIISHATGTEIE